MNTIGENNTHFLHIGDDMGCNFITNAENIPHFGEKHVSLIKVIGKRRDVSATEGNGIEMEGKEIER